MWDPGFRKTNATRAAQLQTSHKLNQGNGQKNLHQLVVPMVTTSWHGHFGSACFTFFAGKLHGQTVSRPKPGNV